MREFGELESAIMDVVWTSDHPVVVREVLENLDYSRSVAYTTVMTVMTILHRKGLLQRHKSGRAWCYRPTETRAQHTARIMNEVLSTSNDTSGTMLRLVERFSDEDMSRLDELLHREIDRRTTTAR